VIYFLTVNYYSSQLIANLIQSISPSKGVDYQVLIINNSPDDQSIHRLKTNNILILESGENIGFGQACNLGLNWIYRQNPQSIVWIINPDTYLLPQVLEKVSPFFDQHSQVSILGTIIYTPNGETWFAGGEFIAKSGAIITQSSYHQTSDLPYSKTDWVSGCSLLINLRLFTDCPQFDSAYFLYYEDFDFCRRYASLGHLIAITNQIAIVHQPSTITGKNMMGKFKHSTYSYLLTIERYSSKIILIVRFIRLLLNAIYLMPIKPKVALGKFHGISLYLRRIF